MRRYIKVNSQWIDTLEGLKQGKYYYIIDGIVYYTMNMCDDKDEKLGRLQDERDN